MNQNTLNNFYHTLKQSSDNHKPYRHRKTHRTDDEVIFRMKLKMAERKAMLKHKITISKARMRRGTRYENGEDTLRQDMEDWTRMVLWY